MLEMHSYFVIELIFTNILKVKLPIYINLYFAFLKCKYLGNFSIKKAGMFLDNLYDNNYNFGNILIYYMALVHKCCVCI